MTRNFQGAKFSRIGHIKVLAKIENVRAIKHIKIEPNNFKNIIIFS